MRHSGFSLVEVLVATVVLAIGLLGLAMLTAKSIGQSHTSATHAQATLLAQALIDRMASNVQGVWLGAYEGTHTGLAGATDACTTAACAPAELAQRDVSQWRSEMAQLLPAGVQGIVDCDAVGIAPRLETTPTYTGTCLVTLSWAETNSDGVETLPSVAWRFRP